MKHVMAGTLAAAVLLVPSYAAPQGANPLMTTVKGQFDLVKGNVLKSAEKVPEALYGFKPTPEVRTFGQILGHIADANNMICSTAAGDKPSTVSVEKTMTTKAELSKALADSMAYCDKVIAGLDDKTGMETVKFFSNPMTPRAMVLAFNTAHDFEHYGNLVTYMRINKIVPPSSEGQQ